MSVDAPRAAAPGAGPPVQALPEGLGARSLGVTWLPAPRRVLGPVPSPAPPATHRGEAGRTLPALAAPRRPARLPRPRRQGPGRAAPQTPGRAGGSAGAAAVRPGPALPSAVCRVWAGSSGHFAKCSPTAQSCMPPRAAGRGVPRSEGRTPGRGAQGGGCGGAGCGPGAPAVTGLLIHCRSEQLVPEPGRRLLRAAPGRAGPRHSAPRERAGRRRRWCSGRGGVFRAGGGSVRCAPAGEATRRPHPACAPGWLGAPRELDWRDPWGRGAARRWPEGKASQARRDFPRHPDPAPAPSARAATGSSDRPRAQPGCGGLCCPVASCALSAA